MIDQAEDRVIISSEGSDRSPGAHTYFFRHIFHNWPDRACHQILRQTVLAMKRQYSCIIIMDPVLPNLQATAYQALLDINMIPLAGIERTNRHRRELLQAVGLRVIKMKT